MCGRVVAATPRERLMELFDVGEAAGEPVPPSFNVAPAATLHAIAGTRRGRRIGAMRWGLVPSWATTPQDGPRPINAKAETLMDRVLFSEALIRRRVVVPVDGFYEWRTEENGKQPYLFQMRDGNPMALAGLWDRWEAPGQPVLVTFTIVTTAANEEVSALHDRMPAILDGAGVDRWLDPTETGASGLLEVLRPADRETLSAVAVSRRVNDARNDDQTLTKPALA